MCVCKTIKKSLNCNNVRMDFMLNVKQYEYLNKIKIQQCGKRLFVECAEIYKTTLKYDNVTGDFI